ncbi:ABC transporter substrate-binding protein [Aureimonas fodinaquatilis]|uniref:ABC transporter substrate-binding protein n=1 Tax=Aureimonas fodinaquatilis TaxID=2565783 RepID=A0A5B0E2M4_9HYPH|nr:ABC transporter substrate-binding protein [Aureimonas fodinaquatilis]KAA0972375.1 ABC transporter substrate-binding protein [Aureimonas fodinaquatilis]
MRCSALALFAALSVSSSAMAADVSVAVTAIVEHPALDAVRDGVKEALEAAGYKDGENLKFTYESAQGNPGTAAQIARQFIGEAPNVIVAISTPSAQAVVSSTRDIPVVFSAVTDPVGAELVTSLETPGGNVTGISDMSPVVEHVALIQEILPEAKTIGFLYNPGEANSVSLLAALKAAGEPAGISVIESTASRTAEVQNAARALVGRADVIYVPTDNTIISALEAALVVADESDLPLITADTDSVERGALAALGFNYHQVGVETGEVVARILKGEAPGSIPVEIASGSNLVVNKSAAAKMGVELPEAVLARANQVIE